MLRDSKWSFETGHPQLGEMYILHPLRPDHYYTVQSFHEKLFDEKRTELIYLLESVGARHIHIETVSGASIEVQKDERSSGKTSDEIVTGGSGEYEDKTHDRLQHDKVQVGIEDRELNPSDQPYIPDDLVWYWKEPSWQRNARSALDKRCKKIEVELRYNEDFSVNQKRMSKVQMDLTMFSKKLDVGWNDETERSLRQRKCMVWKYTATFDDPESNPLTSGTLASNGAEADYAEDLKAAIINGVIAEGARRILERQRIKSGISKERSAQLEQHITRSCLTDAEQEYLQDMMDCSIDGVINDSARQILARRRDKLGVAEKRASELEQMLTTK